MFDRVFPGWDGDAWKIALLVVSRIALNLVLFGITVLAVQDQPAFGTVVALGTAGSAILLLLNFAAPDRLLGRTVVGAASTGLELLFQLFVLFAAGFAVSTRIMIPTLVAFVVVLVPAVALLLGTIIAYGELFQTP